MKEVAKFVSDTKDLIEKVFLKTSFLIVLVSLFWISQWVNNATAMKYFPFIGRLNAPDNYTIYTITLAMLLLLSRLLSWVCDEKARNKTFKMWEKLFRIDTLEKQHKEEIAKRYKEIDKNIMKYNELYYDSEIIIRSLTEKPNLSAYQFLENLNTKLSKYPYRQNPDEYTNCIKITYYEDPNDDNRVHYIIKYSGFKIADIKFTGEQILDTGSKFIYNPDNIIITTRNLQDLLQIYKESKEKLTFAQI